VTNVNAWLVAFLLMIGCHRAEVGPLQGVPAPERDAWPAEPLAVLIAHNPWAMMIGADTPRAEVFNDGTVIRLDPKTGKLFVSQLTRDELARVKDALKPSESFWKLKDDYNVMPNVTDLITTELVVMEGSRFKRIQVYGYSPEKWSPPATTIFPGRGEKADSLPGEFERICKLLVALKPAHELPWTPRYIEVMIWPYDYSPDIPMEWPASWPNLTSPMAFAMQDQYSLILPGSELEALEQYVAKRGERQAILIGGKKWSIDYRPVMPGGRWARDIAARERAQH